MTTNNSTDRCCTNHEARLVPLACRYVKLRHTVLHVVSSMILVSQTIVTVPHSQTNIKQQLHKVKLPGPRSGQGVGGDARIRDRRVTAKLRADLLTIVPPKKPSPKFGSNYTAASRSKIQYDISTPYQTDMYVSTH
ncbi:hypothetical protein PoB_001081100 [Plakobranchus ocellatus]|uniref:Uncharacterized protein n=1 Tax=Plakobranchus ocellatus TaxID=259542 RepID=A0AAV3YAL3_9GAST|nr:hypothetical protein PoB_001081100 [Plakobranchus ocellatus]